MHCKTETTNARVPNHVICMSHVSFFHLLILLHLVDLTWGMRRMLRGDEGHIDLNMKRREIDSGEARLRVHACKECLMCCCGQPVKSDYFSAYLKGI